jgi:hypothetical protein
MSNNESNPSTAQPTDRPITPADADVSVTDGGDVADSDLRPMLNDMLTEAPRTCPLCRGSLTAANGDQYRFKCPDCLTKFLRGDEPNPTPKVALRTTPIRRLKRRKKRMDRVRGTVFKPASALLGDDS